MATANTLPDVTLTQSTWVNLYTASGITVGTAVTLYNKGSQPFYVAISASAPTSPSPTFGIPVYQYNTPTASLSVPSGASGLWAYQPYQNGTVLVQN